MANEIISYLEMCRREAVSLQRGMNFGLGGNHSVILMSVRTGAPYDDRLEDGGTTLIYEGHDEPRRPGLSDPKNSDQPEFTPVGHSTQNGLFHRAARDCKEGRRDPERVRVYEKIRQGIWSYNGVFHLVDSWRERSGDREVFKFKLLAVEGDEDFSRPVATRARCRLVAACRPRHLEHGDWGDADNRWARVLAPREARHLIRRETGGAHALDKHNPQEQCHGARRRCNRGTRLGDLPPAAR